MPKVISKSEFKLHMKKHIEQLVRDNDVLVVANEIFTKDTFIALGPQKMKQLAIASGDEKLAQGIDVVLEQIKQKVSNKYKKIRSLA